MNHSDMFIIDLSGNIAIFLHLDVPKSSWTFNQAAALKGPA
jgi:hypothetical protein